MDYRDSGDQASFPGAQISVAGRLPEGCGGKHRASGATTTAGVSAPAAGPPTPQATVGSRHREATDSMSPFSPPGMSTTNWHPQRQGAHPEGASDVVPDKLVAMGFEAATRRVG